MKNLLASLLIFAGVVAQAQSIGFVSAKRGAMTITPLLDNAVRVRSASQMPLQLDELIYVPQPTTPEWSREATPKGFQIKLAGITVDYDSIDDVLSYYSPAGALLVSEVAGSSQITPTMAQEVPAVSVSQQFVLPDDEHLFGTGQFQDGYVDVRGLSRRLTQVNTQIALPMVLSNKGYALLWNNYGLTNFNPSTATIDLQPVQASDDNATVVDVTTTEGKKQEIRHANTFEGSINVPVDGLYSILLDVGQSMARKHNIAIDDSLICDINNTWLPPTTSFILPLTAGKHAVRVEGVKGDSPTVGWRLVDGTTQWSSPVADALDYTVFAGNPDQAIAAYRKATGPAPLLPDWALGYVHCRERYHNQAELLENATEFRRRGIPIDCIVQDWQYWGKYGWNAMQFDEELYPDPKAMVDSLHNMDIHLMVSVWAKLDANSELGKIAQEKGYYIPGTDWVDFFNPQAADFYWNSQSQRLLQPYGIDAWWQDATEPENDDLVGRRLAAGSIPGEIYRNVFPLMVNKRVHAGLLADDPGHRPMIMTRSAFPGIQRYGVVTWSGDVGNDFETLRRQIAAGLGQMAAGVPYWTFDAGGFFRPFDQYTNPEYHETLIRWLQVGAFLPLMRVHGFVSETEPWRYGPEVEEVFRKTIALRYDFMPYNRKLMQRVSDEGYTMMRPLVMDFPNDPQALAQRGQYMWGPDYLIAPVLELGARQWDVYLPLGADWTDYWTGEIHKGGQTITVDAPLDRIPIFVRMNNEK